MSAPRCWTCGHKRKHHATITNWCNKCPDVPEAPDAWHMYKLPPEAPTHLNEQVREEMAKIGECEKGCKIYTEPPCDPAKCICGGDWRSHGCKHNRTPATGSPRAVVYQLDDYGMSRHELFIEGTATVVVINGGIMVQHEDAAVGAIVSVRPYKGEKPNAPEGHGEPGSAQADMDGA